MFEYSICINMSEEPTSISNAIEIRQVIADRLTTLGFKVVSMDLGGGLNIGFEAETNPYMSLLDMLKEFNICGFSFYKVGEVE